MTIDELLSLHQEICNTSREIMKKKNHDYTGGSRDPFYNFKASAELSGVSAELGIFIRFSDKVQRLRTFLNTGTLQVKDESIKDTIQDSINYLILLQGIFNETHTTQIKTIDGVLSFHPEIRRTFPKQVRMSFSEDDL